MKYDFTNTVLYNDKGVYYKVNSYHNDRLGISQIKKPPEDSGYKLLNLNDLQDGRTSIVYEPKNKK